jgi:hypothetical protein
VSIQMNAKMRQRLILLAVLTFGALALPANAMAVITAPNNGMTHGLEYVATAGNAKAPIRDARGNPLIGSSGVLTAGARGGKCPRGGNICVRVQAIEGIGTASGQTLYYQWPSFGGGEQGFVDRSDLKKAPTLDSGVSNGNGAAQPLYPGQPRYVVTPQPIDQSQGYAGVSDPTKAFTFAPYGLASAFGGAYALMTWNLTNAEYGGGIARAAVSGGESFYGASDPVTLNTYAVAYDPATGTYDMVTDAAGTPVPNGSVNFLYGRIDNGASSTFGWMVASHTTATGACVNHLSAAEGAAIAGALCPPAVWLGMFTFAPVPPSGA